MKTSKITKQNESQYFSTKNSNKKETEIEIKKEKEIENETETETEKNSTKENSTSAWRDEEDEKIQINLNKKNKLKKLKEEGNNLISGKDFQNKLREQFEKLNQKSDIYKWANQNQNKNNEENNININELDNLLKTNKNFLKSTESIDSNNLQINQMEDLTKDFSHKSIISALEFSPIKEDLVFTAGLDEKLKIFLINESENKSINLRTINTQDLPIASAKFTNDGTQILISGKKKHFFVYDLEANKLERCPSLFSNKHIYSLEKMFIGQDQFAFGTQEGFILIHDIKNKCFRYDIKINGSVNSICFDKNGINLYAVGDQSEIYIFDLRKYRTCVNKINDSGNFNTTCMEISRDNNYLATGMYLYIK
jgi:U3 small nucleolar RNA-associated protein 18